MHSFLVRLIAAMQRRAGTPLLVLAVCLVPALAADNSPHLQVGVAQVDITPDYPVRLSGFGGRRAESDGVTLNIWAKALAFADEKNGLAILITAENLCVPDEITSEIARRLGGKIGLKRERLTITATHTHTAPMLKNVCPTLFGVPIPPEHQVNIDRYTHEFIDKLEQAALAAFKQIRPARLSWGNGLVTFAANRRTKGGPVDHDLPMLAVHDLDGKLRAIYFSYACHCVTLSDNKISGDWAGFAQKRIQELFPGVIAMASVGCGADSNPSSGVTGANVEVCAKQGDEIAQEIKRLVSAGLKPINSKPETRYARVDLSLEKARSRAEWETRAKQQDAVGHHARVNLARIDRGESLPDKINYPIQTWVFGVDLAIVFLPGETVVDYSLRLKREFDRARLWVNGYSNDGRCYIPSERILKEGGYEEGGAMIYYDFPQQFAPGLEEKIIDTVASQLPPSFKAPPGTEGTRPLSATEALRQFHIRLGLKVELVAAEPLVQDPVAIDWGPDGRLWVCEMHDYPSGMDQNWQPGGRVKFLVDADADGQYDKATIFLDKLPFPTGVTAWGRGVFICAAPDLLYAEDTNGDGKADKVEKLFTGFHTDNYQARVNSLSLGLDNWIYGANGLLGGTIQPLENSRFPAGKEPINIRNRDFRFHPFTGRFETVSGLTQQGRVRDDWGNWFGCDNSRLLLNFPVPEHYLSRNPHVPAPDPIRVVTSGPDANRLYPTSPLMERFNDPAHANRVTSAAGLGIYRDTYLGDEFYGNAFTCESVHNIVHREVVNRNLAFTSRRAADESDSEFLSSRDNWFRPVQARPGPDGALYIVDMYRFLIEHPRWIPAARLAQIDVRAGADRGRIYRVRNEKPLRPVTNLVPLKGEQLAKALDTPSGIDRDRVQAEILWRKDQTAIPVLMELASKAKLPQIRLQALAVLDGLSGLKPEHIKAALKDIDSGVREHALKLSEPFLRAASAESTGLLESVLALVSDPSIVVLRQLAFTLGESSDPRAGSALASMAKTWLANTEMRTAILSSAKHHCGEILTAVLSTPESLPARADWIEPLLATAANSSDRDLIAQAVMATLPPEGAAAEEGNFAALAMLLDTLEAQKLKLESVLAISLNERVRAVLAQAREAAADSQGSETLRQSALRLLGRADSKQDIELLSRLAISPSENLRRSAVAVLKRQRDPAVAEYLLKNWRSTSPTARGELISVMLDREEWTIALLNAIKDGVVQPSEITPMDRQRLSESPKAELQKMAADILPTQAATGRNEVLENYRAVLPMSGNPKNGAEVFSKNCAACHALNEIGVNVGPDLAALRGRDTEYWIKNILDPNAVVEPRFVNYMVDLKDDRSLSGLIKGENANGLTIVSGTGVSETVLRSDVADIRASSLSLMPEGLEQAINHQQMADLVAFIKSGQTRKIFAGNEPQLITPGADGSLVLPAAKAEIYGGEIAFEPPFQNIGMWHGQDDYVAWTVQAPNSGTYDLFLDYACTEGAAGNKFIITVADQTFKGTTGSTGSSWSDYKQIRLGQLQLPAGTQRITFRPDGPVRSALLDLRAIALTIPGKAPRWPNVLPADPDVLRDPASVARLILDSTKPDAVREAAVNANPQFAAALIAEMTRDLEPGSPEEYPRIPWIWRVAIAAGKRNDLAQVKGVIENSLPKDGETLRDWQAVVIGGGIINGLSLRGLWPAERISEILKDSPDLQSRWNRALDLAAEMAENQKVPAGTRYDALRMIALQSWDKRGAQLVRYLAKDAHPELQMGAVSGLADMRAEPAVAALMAALPHLQGQNRELALDGLLRNETRIARLATNGKPAVVICIDENATQPELNAATELQNVLGEIIGAEPEIKRIDDAAPENAILIGQGRAAKALFADVPFDSLGGEELVNQTKGTRLLLAGGAPRGTLYAVSRFLQDECGVRWWTSWAKSIPKQPNLAIKDLRVREKPAFELREPFWYPAFNAEWAVRNRANGQSANIPAEKGGCIRYKGFVHTFNALVPPEQHFATHPEWYSLINGKRTTERAQLCLTDPTLRDFVAERVRQWIRESPGVSIVSVSQNDWHGACQCEKCKALDEAEGSHSGTMLAFVNYIAEKVEKEFPAVAIDTLAYQYTRKPPKTLKPRPNVIVRLCSIECNFREPLEHPSNASFAEDIRGWSKISDRLFIWDYTTDFAHYVQPHPNWFSLGPNVRFFQKHSVKGLFEQGAYQSHGSEMSELRAWVLAQLLWNPALDDRALIREFVEGYYGPKAAPHILEYFELIHKASEGHNLTCYSPTDAPFLRFSTLSKAEQLWTKAEAASADSPDYLTRIRIARLPLRYVWLSRWDALQKERSEQGGPWPLPESRGLVAQEWENVAKGVPSQPWTKVTLLSEGGLTPEKFLERFKAPRE